MKKIYFTLIIFLTTILSSCELVGGIFKAGYYVGIFVVVFILIIIGVIFYYLRRR